MKLKSVKNIFLLLFAVIALLAAGCQNGVYKQTEGNVADVAIRSKQAFRKSDKDAKPLPTMVVNQGLYVDRTPISLARDPQWLRNTIILRGDQLPFSYYSRTVAAGGGRSVLTRYQTGLDSSVNISVNYSGSVKGALDLIAAKTGYVYTVNGNDIYWQAYVTKTFDIAFMPGSSDYMMGKSGGGTGLSNLSSGGGSSSTNATVTAIVDDSASSQYSSLKGTLSIWKDLETSIGQLLSADGKVMVSQATTTVTVRDRPTNVALISKFISNLNNNLSRQVLVKIQILDIQLNSGYNFGINWNAVKRTLGTNFVLQANYGTPVSITPLVATTTTSPLSGSTGEPQMGSSRIPGVTGVTALISALSQQGKVSIVTEPRVVCLNNQVSAIRILNQEGYIASVQTTNFSGGSGGGSSNNFITSQVTPGTLVTGVTLYILPKILGNRVYLQVNADLSNSLGIQTLSSTTGGSPTSGNNSPVIQTPKLIQKQFNQRSVINSGATLILSGMRQVANQTGAMQLMNSQELGGKAAQQTSAETIVLITPIILHGYA